LIAWFCKSLLTNEIFFNRSFTLNNEDKKRLAKKKRKLLSGWKQATSLKEK
jgi:hypothetical protein